MEQRLSREFFDRDTVTVARELLGKILVRQYQGHLLTGRIVEAEAYIGRCDKACHAYNYRRTARTETLFAPSGHAYVYLIYGMYHCLNLVTEPEGEPAAVLLRAIEPLEGREEMAQLRYGAAWDSLSPGQQKNLANGPGKLCRALAIDRKLNGADLLGDELYLLDAAAPEEPILAGPRIGIDYAQEARDFPWRFTLGKKTQARNN